MFDSDDLIQLVDETGARRHDSPWSHHVEDIDVAALRALFEDLVVVRRIDAEATALQRQGELGLWAPLLEQEAAQVGSARALQLDDFVFASYREHGVAYCRGVDLSHMLRFWRGTSHSGWNPFTYRMTTPAIIVAPSTARDRIRTGTAVRRYTRRGDRLFRRRSHQPGRHLRSLRFRRQLQRSRGVLLPKQPVGDL